MERSPDFRFTNQPLAIASASTAVFIRDVSIAPSSVCDAETKHKLLKLAAERYLAYLDDDEEKCARLHAEGEVAILALCERQREADAKAKTAILN